MAKYDINDYMPKGYTETEPTNAPETANTEPEQSPETANTESEPHTMEPLDLTPEQAPETPKAPQPVVAPKWSRYVSAFFSPLLIATYMVAMLMWITPLSEVPERPRFSATLMIFLITALAPMAYIITMLRMGHIKSVDIPTRRSRLMPALVSIMCLGIGVFYLKQINAPEWLAVTPGIFLISTVLFILLNFRHMVSGHAMNMGTMTGILLYLGVHDYIDVTVSSVVAVSILLTGLVCSARIAVGRHSVADVTIGAVAGFVAGFGAMFLVLI